MNHGTVQDRIDYLLMNAQAAESLCMNGRALNEKAIEVSPSSPRVLDRASEILTPFPPSKNRPRPGDWTCPSCGFSNFQRRTACFRCSYPALGSSGGHENMNYGYGHGSYGMVSGHGPMGGHGHGHGHMGRGGGGGAIIPFRAGDWKCGSEGCGYHNFAKNVSCLRCGASRANAMIVADNSFPQTMNAPSGYGMHPPAPQMAGAPGQFPPPAPAAYGAPGEFHGQQFAAPPSNYAVQSGLGAATAGYPPVGNQFNAPGAPATSFDSRAESAFTSAGQTPSNMGPNMSNGSNYGFEGPSDPFSFLTSGIGGLNINEEGRRNGASNPTKSPQ